MVSLLLTFNNNTSAITPEGGLAVRMINKTGAPTVKGHVVEPSTTTDNGFDLIGIDDPDPIGVIYEADVADGDECLVVVSGRVYIYFAGVCTAANFVRAPATGDLGTDGVAINEALPTPPFATNKHFQEVGHALETTSGAGLALCVIHFN